MTAIQRFAIHGTIMNPHSSGPYVRHEDHLAAMQARCLAQIEEPAQPVAPVLDDCWKARMLDGRAPERDEMGFGNHPELPSLDEGMMPRSFFAALGLELAHTSAEDQLDGDVLGAMSEAVNWTHWLPTPPHGDGWKLVSIFDTEDGPVAWWLRALPEAEDGTTTIRNLQAEVEKLKARLARAGAAPAAVAPRARDLLGIVRTAQAEARRLINGEDSGSDLAQTKLDLPETLRVLEHALSRPAAVAGPAWGEQQVHALAIHMPASAPPSHKPRDYDADMAWARSALNFIAGHAPALEAPAAPAQGLAIPDDCPHIIWFDDHEMQPAMFAGHGARAAALEKFKRISLQWNAHLFVRIDRNSRDDRFSVAALAAAPQAPAAPSGVRYKQEPGSSNCMQCAMAFMLGLCIDQVPDFAASGSPKQCWELFESFAEAQGYSAVMIPGNRSFEADYLVSGTSPRGTPHMVVMNDGRLVHDPHPSNAGLSDVQCVWLLARRAAAPQAPVAPDPRTPADMRVNGGALKLALNVLRRAGKSEVADELEKTAAPAAPAVDAELLELAQAIVKFNREHGSILAVHIDNLADLVDERAAQAAAKGSQP